MGNIIKIDNAEISHALKDTTRQYFVGNLSRPQQITFIRDERLEVGISSYPVFKSEAAHVHNTAIEYQYVISGYTEYLDTESGVVYTFKKGDFYAIEPGTAYAQKVKAGTSILFIKVPSINDKQIVGLTEEQLKWISQSIKTVRTDYYHQDNAPAVNSIKPATAVAVFNKENKLLMLNRGDNKKWTMPGGTMEFGESLIDCALREVKEESGISVKINDVIGIYTDPNVRISYSDGEVRQEFTVVYYGIATNYDVVLDEESTRFQWVPLDKIFELPLADSQRRRLEDVIKYINSGVRKIT